MPKYRVLVTSDVTVSCTVTVEAESVEAAKDAAIEKCIDEGVSWERDDVELQPYVWGDEGVELLALPTKTHDTAGLEWAKLSELKDGDKINLDTGFTCAGGQHTVHCDDDEGLYFRCAHGRHYLSGQADDGDHCIGVYKV